MVSPVPHKPQRLAKSVALIENSRTGKVSHSARVRKVVRWLIRIWLLSIVTIYIIAATRAKSPIGNGQLLTVEETVALVFIDEWPWHLYRHANPKARPSLYNLLANKNPTYARYHRNAYFVLAHCGDSSDVCKMRASLNSFTGVLDPWEIRSVKGILYGLGILARRDNAEAANALQEMSNIEYWTHVNFMWYSDEAPRAYRLSSELESLCLVMWALEISNSEAVEQVRASLVECIDDSRDRASFESRMSMRRIQPLLDKLERAETIDISDAHRAKLMSIYDYVCRNYNFWQTKSIADESSDEVYTEEEANNMIVRGDAKIVPFLRRWVAKETEGWKYYIGIDGLAKFGDRGSLEALKAVANGISITLAN